MATGSLMFDKMTETRWIYINDEMVYRSVTYVPALLIFLDDAIKSMINYDFFHFSRGTEFEERDRRYLGIDVNQKCLSIYVEDLVADPYNCPYKIMAEVFRTPCNESENWTKITYKPDFVKLNMTHLDDDIIGLMQKKVIDWATKVGICVTFELNGKKLPLEPFVCGWLVPNVKQDGMRTAQISKIENFVDARFAGGPNSAHCILIVAEGLAGMELARARIDSANVTQIFGVYGLTGKFVNVKGAKASQAWNNKHVLNLMEILGLERGKEYTSAETLRYGHLMIMADEDHDGSHIIRLLINFFHSFWPSLLEGQFLSNLLTPIIQANSKDGIEYLFYSIDEFEDWKNSDTFSGRIDDYTIKHYKGLGTSTRKEGDEHFGIMNVKIFKWASECNDKAINLAFNKDAVQDRKKWLLKQLSQPGIHVDGGLFGCYNDFMYSAVVDFFVADLKRSIPSMGDGLNTIQRKILFSSFDRHFVKEQNVLAFSVVVANHTSYHHNEESLSSTMIRMAQNYTGSNNLNLFESNGDFGSRNLGGSNHAPGLCLWTRLSPIARFLFPKDDDRVLNYLQAETSVEPRLYAPTIPTILVNGCVGVGAGLKTCIPNFNPKDIIKNVKHLLNDEELEEMIPWYRGFTGDIIRESDTSYIVRGVICKVDDTTLLISELPIGKWTQVYVEDLAKMVVNGEIEGFNNQSDYNNIKIEVKWSKEKMRAASKEDLLRIFKLIGKIKMSNMHLFNADGLLKKYNSPREIIQDHFHYRLEIYEKRKAALLAELELKLVKLNSKIEFISENINLYMKGDAEIVQMLKEKGFPRFPMENEEGVINHAIRGYEYLICMPYQAKTLCGFQSLLDASRKVQKEIDDLRCADPKSIWLNDLNALELELDSYQELEKLPYGTTSNVLFVI